VLAQHRGTDTDAAFVPDGTLIVTGASNGDVRVWDAATGAPRARFECDDRVNALAVSPDGTVVAATTTITARGWELATSIPEIAIDGGHDYLEAVAFALSGALLGIASTDKTASVWDVTTGVPVAILPGHGSSVTAIAFSPVSPPGQVEVATGSLDGIARIWDAATGRPGITLSGHSSWIHALAYAPSGAMIATGSGDNTARTWDAATGAARATLRGHSG
jgi:WD40 repeat protein